MSMSWRLASRLSVVTLALLVILVIAIFSMRNGLGSPVGTSPDTSQSGLQGTDLGSVLAPDFRLKDQFGKSVALSQFKGMPVVVTFMYTHCPDVCPLDAEKMHSVMLSLGKNAPHVAFLVVSMDPKGDTQATALHFSDVHKMTNSWHYLIGSLNQLSPIWESYSVDAQAATQAGIVNHSTFVYVIDKEGRERVLLDNEFTSAQLTSDLRVLLRE